MSEGQGKGNVVGCSVVTGGILAVMVGTLYAAVNIYNSVEETAKASNEPARIVAVGDLVVKTAQANQMDAVTRMLEMQTNMLVAYQMLGISIGFLMLIALLVTLFVLFRACQALKKKEMMIDLLLHPEVAAQ